MRWHPMLIKFAMFICQQSPCVYRSMRNMGILKVTGESTLRDDTSVLSSAPGFQVHHRYVCLLHDEMSIKSDRVFDRKSNEIIRYVSPEEFDSQKV